MNRELKIIIALVVIAITIGAFAFYISSQASANNLSKNHVDWSITIDYANQNGVASSKTFSPSPLSILTLANSNNPSALSIAPQPLTIEDPSKSDEVATGYTVNLALTPVYTLAAGASISSWSFTGTATTELEIGSTVVYNWGTFPLSCPPTVTSSPTSTLTSSGGTQVMFSSTGSFTGGASTNVFYNINFINGQPYNYVFTLNAGAVFSITDSLGNTATYTTTQPYTLTWEFVYVASSTSISSLSITWSGSSITS